jgi:hypothetical protein
MSYKPEALLNHRTLWGNVTQSSKKTISVIQAQEILCLHDILYNYVSNTSPGEPLVYLTFYITRSAIHARRCAGGHFVYMTYFINRSAL